MSVNRLYALIAWVWTLLLATTCLLPPSSLKRFNLDSLLQFDKLLHAFVFYVLYIAWYSYFKRNNKLSTSLIVVLSIACIAYGLGIEFVQQTKLIGRSFEWADFIADTLGCLLSVITVRLWPNLAPYYKKYLPFVN